MHERKKGDQNTKESHKPEEEICMKYQWQKGDFTKIQSHKPEEEICLNTVDELAMRGRLSGIYIPLAESEEHFKHLFRRKVAVRDFTGTPRKNPSQDSGKCPSRLWGTLD